jgi:hypothetical protein
VFSQDEWRNRGLGEVTQDLEEKRGDLRVAPSSSGNGVSGLVAGEWAVGVERVALGVSLTGLATGTGLAGKSADGRALAAYGTDGFRGNREAAGGGGRSTAWSCMLVRVCWRGGRYAGTCATGAGSCVAHTGGVSGIWWA